MKINKHRRHGTARRLLAVAALALIAVTVPASPASATDIPNLPFLGTVGGIHLCLDTGGANALQVPPQQLIAQQCTALGNARQHWFSTNVGGTIFTIRNVEQPGCLVNSGGIFTNGNPVVFQEAASCDNGTNLDAQWVWMNDRSLGYQYLVPERYLLSGHSCLTNVTPVLSIAGPGVNGSKIHLWHVGANNNLQ